MMTVRPREALGLYFLTVYNNLVIVILDSLPSLVSADDTRHRNTCGRHRRIFLRVREARSLPLCVHTILEEGRVISCVSKTNWVCLGTVGRRALFDQ